MTDNYPYQPALDVIHEAGGKAGRGHKPYRLLHKLAKAKGIYMHGSQPFIGQVFDIPKRKMNKMAIEALKRYCDEGILQIPDEFRYSDTRSYRHDGEGEANRNLWRNSNKAAKDHRREKPVEYSLNTVKK